ncbi:MAG: DUF2934 domain-containing protein [Nitrococcus sp.]|nr:DUF2934 domain-containing protein [Nitrococcus sp.]
MSVSKLSVEERHKMIAEAAYFRAQGRGFDGRDAVADWIEAESEINARLRQIEHNALLDRLRERLAAAAENLRTLRGKVSRKKAEARAEWQKDLEKLAQSRAVLEHKLDELGARGQQASRKLREQAEEIAAELSRKISELGDRLSARRRSPAKD